MSFFCLFIDRYWGYDNMSQVEGYMRQFRERALPIDSFIMDYDVSAHERQPPVPSRRPHPCRAHRDTCLLSLCLPAHIPMRCCRGCRASQWFGPDPCPKKGGVVVGGAPTPQGGYNCGDYGYRRGWWNNMTFVQPDGTTIHCTTAADVFAHFAAPPLSMHFGAIRKPRTYSNKELCASSGWLLPNASDVGEGGDINFNFSAPGMSEWYVSVHKHFVRDGMDFWWNDEGETSWFTYLKWNDAQAAQYAAARPNTRHFTINRSWQPGMQRFPAVTWTGDGQSCTHQELLRGVLNGCPLTSCDLTSPDATTLVRQYQSAVFTPIMRVHEMQGTPRMPWFWPGPASAGYTPERFDETQRAFQLALELRYLFLPFMYSLAHVAHRRGRPIAHPASFAFPSACAAPTSRQCSDAQNTYMVGGVLLPSDLGLVHTNQMAGKLPAFENVSVTILPAESRWYRWNTTAALAGGQTIKETLGLAEMAVFVRAGAILPLQGGSVAIQRSALAGGVLELQVYSGTDGHFEMVEDDGISLDYQTSPDTATRTTTWRWNNAARTLSWKAQGGAAMASNSNRYTTVMAVLFEEGAVAPQRASQLALTSTGKVIFDNN